MGFSFAVRRAAKSDERALVRLIAQFRVALAALEGLERHPDEEAARRELEYYGARGYPIFVAETSGEIVGFLVCRVDEDVVWAEAMFVQPEYRRRGIATELYKRAEALATSLGSPTVYNWIHPNNEAIIHFLQKRGYTVLNLVEVRRPYPGEKIRSRVQVGEYEFGYPAESKP